MNEPIQDKETSERITRLTRFRELVQQYSAGQRHGNRRVGALDDDELSELRSLINREAHWARQQVIEAGTFQTFTIAPPPAVGGLIARDVDAFTSMFNSPYGLNLFRLIIDMVDGAIGVLSTPRMKTTSNTPTVQVEMRKNYAFVAMAIDKDNPELEDVLDAIKESANRCGVQAERIDEEQSNERITDRILESIRTAEHVIVDLTGERPNVFFEAGFAHGFGKIPIYIAKEGTRIHFDLKDYPVIFFKNYKHLKDNLESRLRAISVKKA
jgi:hypothetical protein